MSWIDQRGERAVKIAVTGAGGHAGTNLVRALRAGRRGPSGRRREAPAGSPARGGIRRRRRPGRGRPGALLRGRRPRLPPGRDHLDRRRPGWPGLVGERGRRPIGRARGPPGWSRPLRALQLCPRLRYARGRCGRRGAAPRHGRRLCGLRPLEGGRRGGRPRAGGRGARCGDRAPHRGDRGRRPGRPPAPVASFAMRPGAGSR